MRENRQGNRRSHACPWAIPPHTDECGGGTELNQSILAQISFLVGNRSGAGGGGLGVVTLVG
jgi:hypothetical protein